MKQEKLLYLLWPKRTMARDDLTGLMLKNCAEDILKTGTPRLELHVADADSDMKSPAPNLTKDEPVQGVVSVLLDPSRKGEIESILYGAGFRFMGYLVEESIYKDYGDNNHSGPRDWPDGRRSPGVTALTLMERPEKIPPDEWVRRWHGTMSPVSEMIQPRTRYVRNLVKKILTEGAYNLSGIVTEAWPSKKHVSNPFLFYGAKNPVQLAINIIRILRAVTSILQIRRIRTYMLSEYFIKTGFHR